MNRSKALAHSVAALAAALAAFLLSCAALHAGEADVPDMPKPVQDTMQAMQNVFGGIGGPGAGGGPSAEADIKTIKKLLAKERNIKIWDSRGRIFLEGRVTSQHMQKRIQKLLEIYANLVDLTEYRPDMDTFLADMELIKGTIEATLNKNYTAERAFVGKQAVSVTIVNDKIVLSGELNTQEDIDKALHIAKIYNESVIDNLSVRKQMIEVAAIFAKMKRNNTETIGTEGAQSAIIALPSLTGTAPDTTPRDNPIRYFEGYEWAGGPVTATLGGANDISLNFRQMFGKSAVLARPHLATINGQTSRFMGGGEKAIKTVTANSSDVNYKEYGVLLTATPSLTTDGRINLQLELEFSVPEANGEDFITFRHEGQALLSSGQGLVLSGLINESRSRELSRTPFLGSVPILKFFFSKKGDSKEKEDLVLVTIPRVPGRVARAGYPKSEETAETAEDASWIRKPSLPRRVLDHIHGKEGEYWKEGFEVEVDTSPSDYRQEAAPDAGPGGQGEEAGGYRPGAALGGEATGNADEPDEADVDEDIDEEPDPDGGGASRARQDAPQASVLPLPAPATEEAEPTRAKASIARPDDAPHDVPAPAPASDVDGDATSAAPGQTDTILVNLGR